MGYIPKRVRFDEFPPEGIFGITARHALELAIDGDLTVYHLIPSEVTVFQHLVGEKYVGADFGKWHGLTIKVPRGTVYHLSFHANSPCLDSDGKSTALLVEGPIGTPDMRPEIPLVDSYTLWPEGGSVITFERDKLFFLGADLKHYAETLPQASRTIDPSDAALGASVRQQRSKFGQKPRENQEARATEYQRWRDAANEIQRSRTRPASKRELGGLVKAHLNLPDSPETIRRYL